MSSHGVAIPRFEVFAILSVFSSTTGGLGDEHHSRHERDEGDDRVADPSGEDVVAWRQVDVLARDLHRHSGLFGSGVSPWSWRARWSGPGTSASTSAATRRDQAQARGVCWIEEEL